MTFDGVRSFVYDSENRLSNPAAPFHYDPLGRLAGISTSPGAPLALAYDHSEGEGLIAERVPGSLAPIKRHVFGPGVDEPLIWYEGSGTGAPRYLHADERGSIVAVSDGSGAVQNFMRYDEYGRVQDSNPYWLSRFGFTGQRYFGGFGLYHYKNRMYDPRAGRFMQPEPIGCEGGMNLYAYVGGGMGRRPASRRRRREALQRYGDVQRRARLSTEPAAISSAPPGLSGIPKVVLPEGESQFDGDSGRFGAVQFTAPRAMV
ncbi:MAG TPA: RHS repeat-associated core domain-containing protein [Allosphingosinicella sp.]|jgi:RHS repeat-associated protein